MLSHDRDTDCFVGPAFAVPNPQFLASMRGLLMNGWSLSQALDYLLDETHWSTGAAGVDLLLSVPPVLAQAEAILASARRRNRR